MSRKIFLIVTALLLASCASSAPAIEWTTIKMSQSGGFIGLSRSIEISADGKYIAVDNRANKTVNGELSADELFALNKLVAGYKSANVMKPENTGCADCFVYDLQIQGSGKNISAQLNDVTLPKSGMEALVNFLRETIDKALK